MGNQGSVRHLRMRRLMLAMAASWVTALMVGLVALGGYLAFEAAAIYAAIVAICCIAFYAMIRSNLNEGFADPTLSAPQLVASGLAISYVIYAGDATRPLFMAMYVMAFMFAFFALTLRGLVGLAIFYVACYAAAVGPAILARPAHADLNLELVRILVFAILLAWMIFLGRHINGLRQQCSTLRAHSAATAVSGGTSPSKNAWRRPSRAWPRTMTSRACRMRARWASTWPG